MNAQQGNQSHCKAETSVYFGPTGFWGRLAFLCQVLRRNVCEGASGGVGGGCEIWWLRQSDQLAPF